MTMTSRICMSLLAISLFTVGRAKGEDVNNGTTGTELVGNDTVMFGDPVSTTPAGPKAIYTELGGLSLFSQPAQPKEAVDWSLRVQCELFRYGPGISKVVSMAIARQQDDGFGDTVWKRVAHITFDEPAVSNVKAQIAGSIDDENGRSYLSLKWDFPDENQAGLYRCDVNALTVRHNAISDSAFLEVAIGSEATGRNSTNDEGDELQQSYHLFVNKLRSKLLGNDTSEDGLKRKDRRLSLFQELESLKRANGSVTRFYMSEYGVREALHAAQMCMFGVSEPENNVFARLVELTDAEVTDHVMSLDLWKVNPSNLPDFAFYVGLQFKEVEGSTSKWVGTLSGIPAHVGGYQFKIYEDPSTLNFGCAVVVKDAASGTSEGRLENEQCGIERRTYRPFLCEQYQLEV